MLLGGSMIGKWKPDLITIWKSAQEAEQIYWQKRCNNAVGVMYEMAEHSDLADNLLRVIDGKPSAVLDVGIGPMGIGLLWLFPDSRIKIGLDSLSKMKVQTGNPYVDSLVHRIHGDSIFIRARGENLPFPAESFDLVVCNNVLDHAISTNKLLEELYRVTKRKGHLGIGVDTNSLLGFLIRLINRRLKPHYNPYRLHPYDIKISEINKHIQFHGFHILCHNDASMLGAIMGRRRMQWWVALKGE